MRVVYLRARESQGGPFHQAVRAEALYPAAPALQRGRRAAHDVRPRGLSAAGSSRLRERQKGDYRIALLLLPLA